MYCNNPARNDETQNKTKSGNQKYTKINKSPLSLLPLIAIHLFNFANLVDELQDSSNKWCNTKKK